MAKAWLMKDIIYVTIVGTLIIAAVFEWFLWLCAFLYCLFKVFKKADDASTRYLAMLMTAVFVLLRAAFLPIIVVTLPFPDKVFQQLSAPAVRFLQWFAFWTYAWLLIVPFLLCVYQLTTHFRPLGRQLRLGLDGSNAPKVAIVMPCYRELPKVLMRTVDSISDCDYPSDCLHVFLSFDSDLEDELYLGTLHQMGVPLIRRSGFPTSIDIIYKRTRVTVSRFSHGGKRRCQKQTFKLVDRIYSEYVKAYDDLYILFIDSDCILDRACIHHFMHEMQLARSNYENVLAMTGVITSSTEKNSLITLLQDVEYIHGQLFERAVESGCGAVTCLPGALAIMRFSAFRQIARYYFSDKAEACEDLFDYAKCHLGEDRWLTHLLIRACSHRHQIGFSIRAFCKTEAVQTCASLLKQRRRWFLGFVTNEVCMLTDIQAWRRFPFLCLLRLAHSTIRTTSLLFFVVIIALVSSEGRAENLPVGFIVVGLCLNWGLMALFAIFLRRWKGLAYPVLFVIGPFFTWLYTVYAVFTAGRRTWGGPRADAGSADARTTPHEAIETALATGNELNVVPESFRPAIRMRNLMRDLTPPRLPLQPPSKWSEKLVQTRHSRRESGGSSASGLSEDDVVQWPRRATSLDGTSWDVEGPRPRSRSRPPMRVGRGERASYPPQSSSAFFEEKSRRRRIFNADRMSLDSRMGIMQKGNGSGSGRDDASGEESEGTVGHCVGGLKGHASMGEIPLVSLAAPTPEASVSRARVLWSPFHGRLEGVDVDVGGSVAVERGGRGQVGGVENPFNTSAESEVDGGEVVVRARSRENSVPEATSVPTTEDARKVGLGGARDEGRIPGMWRSISRRAKENLARV